MSKFNNLWTNGSETINSETRPTGTDEYDFWYPVINDRRITGATYRPYNGNSEWVKAANKMMADQAQANFQRSQMA